jgi:CRP/FNR family transcriptional regulator, cyclic AMP receptor protein
MVPSATPVRFGLSSTQLADLSRHAVAKRYKRNTIIFSEGDPTDALYILVEGRVRIYVADPNGKEVTLNTQGPGEYFGEMTLDGGARSASVITLEPCRVLRVQRESLRECFETNPDFAVHLVHKLIHRIRVLTERVKSLALQDVYGRFRGMLEELAVADGDVRVVPGKLTQADIASRVGASREMISRILSDLKAGGYISHTRCAIVIHRDLPMAW